MEHTHTCPRHEKLNGPECSFQRLLVKKTPPPPRPKALGQARAAGEQSPFWRGGPGAGRPSTEPFRNPPLGLARAGLDRGGKGPAAPWGAGHGAGHSPAATASPEGPTRPARSQRPPDHRGLGQQVEGHRPSEARLPARFTLPRERLALGPRRLRVARARSPPPTHGAQRVHASPGRRPRLRAPPCPPETSRVATSAPQDTSSPKPTQRPQRGSKALTDSIAAGGKG